MKALLRGTETEEPFAGTGIRPAWAPRPRSGRRSLGGKIDEVWVEAELDGLAQLPPGEYNVLAHAVNEALDDLAEPWRGPAVPSRGLHSEEDQRRRGG